ncbi:Trehalose-phosphate synthase [Dermatophilus congolensis]|uniref:Trehalose-phosphate synthase n=3 Tax=Dermatophilus congolensis TaxID=1863 RepID=A0A239VD43_9MICO|nr:trehalose-6-phosphate synthase [Dermatophilus congolensis]SNV20050.1 Trehalose-phosphate synthase [Dermatophilus congolensis]
MPETTPTFDFVIAANRLPVDSHTEPDGTHSWKRSPGGLVTAMDSVMRNRSGAWVGWAGDPGEAPAPFDDEGMHLHPIALSAEEVKAYYEGFSNDTLWPIYHDVIVPAQFHRSWWHAYQRVNRRFADEIAIVAAPKATIWVHDYQLQLVPALLRAQRPDLRIGWFNHIPFPPLELFSQLPWRRNILEGLASADFLGFQRPADASNFLHAAKWAGNMTVKGDTVTIGSDSPHAGHTARAAALPISIDFENYDDLARRPSVVKRAKEIREELGNPDTILLGVDRLDYTKGIRHRLKAYQELLTDGRLEVPGTTLIQVAVPSRERVQAYQHLRDQVELNVGQVNGEFSDVTHTALQYLHQSMDREELAAMYRAADIMLVTPLRDGMNLVAKEYVACRPDHGGALVLSEFTGAAIELNAAYIHNPHDIQGLKDTIIRAIHAPREDNRKRMRTLRRKVRDNSVQKWAEAFLTALDIAPAKPSPRRNRKTTTP